jgi:CO/xanthine dehydrogenase FAD-binding subunit
MKLASYHRPTTLDEARTILKELGADGIALAGGTSHGFMRGDDEKTAVDLAWIGYDRIESSADGFVIGANTRIADLQNFHAPGWVLDRIALRFVSQPMRNMSTIGGNIARVFPWNAFPVALLALDAEMTIAGEQEEKHPATSYFKGQPARLYKPGDLLTTIAIPAVGPGCGFGYHKETVVNMDFSLLTLAVWMRLEKRTITGLRVAAGAGVPVPKRLTELEDALLNKAVSASAIEQAVASTVDAVRWKGGDGFSDDYIRTLASVHLVDALTEAWQMAKGGAA